MPELPEVEEAARRLRRALVGRSIARLRLLHPALQRRTTPAVADSLAGARITGVERRGKHQLIALADGRTLHVHFRMNGDWEMGSTDDEPPRFARALLELDDGSRVCLVDSRALATVDVHDADAAPDLGLGPEANDPAVGTGYLSGALASRRGPIKPALLDQRVLAGVGNIYAAEALWRARLDPRTPANALDESQVAALLEALRAVIAKASGGRYRQSDSADAAPTTTSRLAVYDREGKPCRRCRTPIQRIVQAGRSTYFCPSCQAEPTPTRRSPTRRTAMKKAATKKAGTKKAVTKATARKRAAPVERRGAKTSGTMGSPTRPSARQRGVT